jgi:hypothetical protein
VKIELEWVEETVDRDRQMYGLTDARFELLKAALLDTPRAGKSRDGVNYEYLFGGLMVHYVLVVQERRLLVLIMAVRPPEAVSRSKEVMKILRQVADLARAIRSLAWLFGGGE